MAFSRSETLRWSDRRFDVLLRLRKVRLRTAAQDCSDKTAAWDKEAGKLQRLKSQRDESIAKLAKLDQEIHGLS